MTTRTNPGLEVEVKIISSQSARVSWQVPHPRADQLVVTEVEIICSPVGAR